MDIYYNNKYKFNVNSKIINAEFYSRINDELHLKQTDYYILCNGKQVNQEEFLNVVNLHIVPKLLGGKGGFGSMLRAIGAQIEKTTNREACRDLSGRRLRDINEEKRLKEWIDQQAERERDTTERKLKKLEQMCQKPKHEFKDDNYDKERSDLPERIEDAVAQGLNASASTSGTCKRKIQSTSAVKKKKKKMWLDDDLEDEISSSDEDSKPVKDTSITTLEDKQPNKTEDKKPTVSVTA